jgi:hypothetical protein
MRNILRTLLTGLMLTATGGIVSAGPLEDGIAAHEHGDYAVAFRKLRPLANQGSSEPLWRRSARGDRGRDPGDWF